MVNFIAWAIVKLCSFIHFDCCSHMKLGHEPLIYLRNYEALLQLQNSVFGFFVQRIYFRGFMRQAQILLSTEYNRDWLMWRLPTCRVRHILTFFELMHSLYCILNGASYKITLERKTYTMQNILGKKCTVMHVECWSFAIVELFELIKVLIRLVNWRCKLNW